MSSEGGQLAQLWCIHTGAFFSCSEDWRADLRCSMGGRSVKEASYCRIPFIGQIQNKSVRRNKADWCCQGPGNGERV